MRQTVIERVLAYLFGQKYWVCPVYRKGTSIVEMSCFIYDSREKAEKYVKDMQSNMSFQVVGIVSFRSRLPLILK